MLFNGRFLFKSIALLSLIVLAGCSAKNNGETTIEPTTLGNYSADSNSEFGSRNNPVPLGKIVVVNNWSVQVSSVNNDALKAVKASDPYSNNPAFNERFVQIYVKATYVGEESGEPSSDLRFKVVGSKGNTFAKSCGYSSDTFNNNGETFPGASVAGNLCFIVETDQISGATLSVQGDYSSEDRKFISLGSR